MFLHTILHYYNTFWDVQCTHCQARTEKLEKHYDIHSLDLPYISKTLTLRSMSCSVRLHYDNTLFLGVCDTYDIATFDILSVFHVTIHIGLYSKSTIFVISD